MGGRGTGGVALLKGGRGGGGGGSGGGGVTAGVQLAVNWRVILRERETITS